MQTPEKILTFIVITFLFLLLNPLFSIILNSDYDTFKDYYFLFISILSLINNFLFFGYYPKDNYEYMEYLSHVNGNAFIYLVLIISLNVFVSLVFIGYLLKKFNFIFM